ncbi:MAG: hypothetical protein HC904_16860 [Blastochloris sp.]|nr:hypothetical protein [Blastochloris sp.]
MDAKIKLEENNISIAIPSDIFDAKLKDYLDDRDFLDTKSLYDRIIYYREELPSRPSIWLERLWWLGAVLAGLIFLFGLYHVCLLVIGPFIDI